MRCGNKTILAHVRDDVATNHHPDLACASVVSAAGTQRQKRLASEQKNYLLKSARAYIERAQPMPKQGISSSFNYGMTYGMILSALAAAEIPYEEVSAAKWKRVLRVSKEKDIARRRASELMPHGASCWPLKKHHNRAEAALIAFYGKELLTRES